MEFSHRKISITGPGDRLVSLHPITIVLELTPT